MKILFLAKYGRKAASSRYRFLQYIPFLEKAGFDCTVSELFSDRYLEQKFETGRLPLQEVGHALGRRIHALLTAKRFDLVFIHCEAFPYLPAFAERLLKLRNIPYVVDYDDAIFHNYDQHPRRLVRMLVGNKMKSVLAGAAWVFAGNEYLADYARAVNASVDVLPTVIDLQQYPLLAREAEPKRPITVGWIGSPSTAGYLKQILEPLRSFCSRTGGRVHLVGSGPVDLPGLPVEVFPWSEDSEVQHISRFDLGIMPVPDTPWGRGKCGFKLIQYMAAALPVVASPVGVNSDVVTSGVNGFLASNTSEWLSALDALAGSAEERARMGARGRQRVEERYCLQVTAPRMVERLSQLAGA